MMNICMIGCWYRDDIYSHHCHNLMEELKNENSFKIKFVTSNCNCFSSRHKCSIAEEELLNTECDVVKILYAPLEPNKEYGRIKYYIVKMLKLNLLFETLRGVSFFTKTKGCKIVHFDQVLKAFGFVSFATLLVLSKMFNKKLIVTVHELDTLQERYKKLNGLYNYVDKVIVFSSDFREQLIELGVKENKIEMIPYGVRLEPIKALQRDQFIFFGGHKLLKGKGFDTLLRALDIMKSRGKEVRVIIYVGENCIGLEEGKKKVSDMGLDRYITWSEFLYGSKLAEAYQRSIGCLVPYTGGSGRHPATSAMANATPVIATNKASLPEYLGELGIFIKEESPEELVEAIIHLLDNPTMVNSLGKQLRERAEKGFSCNIIARQTLRMYAELIPKE